MGSGAGSILNEGGAMSRTGASSARQLRRPAMVTERRVLDSGRGALQRFRS